MERLPKDTHDKQIMGVQNLDTHNLPVTGVQARIPVI